MVKHLPTKQETWVQSLGPEDPLEKAVGTHSSTLAWKNPMDGGAWEAAVHGITNSRTQLSDFTFICVCVCVCIIYILNVYIFEIRYLPVNSV